MESMKGIFIPLIIGGGIIAIFAFIMVFARNYIKVPNSKAVFFYGKGSRKVILPDGTQRTLGMMVVTGGARFKRPFVESIAELDLTEITVPELKVEHVPNKDGVLVTVNAVANVKFYSDEAHLMAAAERFLGKNPQYIEHFVRNNLEGHLRGVVGTLTVEEMISDRQKFQSSVRTEAGEDLNKVGMLIDIFNIQNISDAGGYIEALGVQKTAEVKRNAAIGKAEAERESRIKSTNALREAEVVAQDNLKKEKEAQKDTNVAAAGYDALTNAEKARADQAGPLAKAEAEKAVKIAETKVKEEQTRAEIAVEEQAIQKEMKRQEWETIVPAQAKATAAIKESEGTRQAAINTAEGQKASRIAAAEANQRELEAQAAGDAAKVKQVGLANAEVTKLTGLAQAAATEAELLALAKGTEEIAKAYNAFTPEARLLKIMELLPAIIRELPPVMTAVAAPLGNIDRVTIVDAGGGNGKGPGQALVNYGTLVPRILEDISKSAGVDLSGLLGKLAIKVGEPGVIPPQVTTEKK